MQTRRAFVRSVGVTGTGVALAGAWPASAWLSPGAFLGPFLRDVAIAVAADQIGKIGGKLIEAAVDRLDLSAGAVTTWISDAVLALAEGGFGLTESTRDVHAVPETIFLGAESRDQRNGCAAFLTARSNGAPRTVMVEGPTVLGLHTATDGVRSRTSADPEVVRRAVLPIAEIQRDVGRFDESYDALHRSVYGEIKTAYRTDGAGRGTIDTHVDVGAGHSKRTRKFHQEIRYPIG